MEAERHQKSKPPLASEDERTLLPHCFVVNVFPECFSEVEQIAQV